MRLALAVFITIGLAPAALVCQEFEPPSESGGSGFRLGLLGFGTRAGIDFEGDDQFVLGVALDLGDLGTPRVRLRPSAELGVGGDVDTYVFNIESVFRFTDDVELAVPYVGLGLGIFGREHCAAAPDCPDAWVNALLGFELRFRPTFNWLLEYHGLDALRRNRIYIGLTTRRVP